MKKVFMSLVFFAGVYGLSFAQMGSSSSSSSSSASQDWVKIGEKTINLSSDKDVTVNANQMYSEIRFKAIDEPVDLSSVEVQYSNGQKQTINVDSKIQANEESKPFTLNSSDKLDKITLNFNNAESSSSKEKARIEVLGLKSGSSSGMGSHSSYDRNNSGSSSQSSSDMNQKNR